MQFDWQPLWLSFKLGLMTTGALFALGMPIAWWLARSNTSGRIVVRALVNMPFVLPPSVIGFYLMLALSPAAPLGRLFGWAFHTRLIFSFPGIVIGSILFSLPFMVNPLTSGLEAIPASLSEAASVLGKSSIRTLFSVLLPNMKPALFTALIMTFAHTIGEFGVVLMIGGKVPGITKVASIAVYDEMEALNIGSANNYALILVSLSMIILTALYYVNHKQFRPVVP